ncbi:hypothetical protein JCM10296v2_004453 [Rhodotorula toruloides]
MSVSLPPELVTLCLQQLDPSDRSTVPTLLNASLASRSFKSLALAPLLWKPIADETYHRHRPPSSAGPSFEDDAFDYFRQRAAKDLRARSIIRELATQPTKRLAKMEELRRLGSDVIENRLWRPEEFTEEKRPSSWLCLQYWARESRKALLRKEAVRVWREIALRGVRGEEADDDFERGMNAFGAFRGYDPMVLPRERFDVSNHPRLVEATSHPPFEGSKRLEWIAREAYEYTRLIGLKPAIEGAYHNLDCQYVEPVWNRAAGPSAQNHGTLPMTLVGIYCSLVRRLPIARELRIRVRPVGFPGTVLAALAYEGSNEWTYINVFSSGKILSRDRLLSLLGAMGQAGETHFLEPASAREMCLRVARNILTAVRTGEQAPGIPLPHETAIAALYSVSHALFILTNPQLLLGNERTALDRDVDQYFEWMCSLIQSEFPLDVHYLESALPILSAEVRPRISVLCEAIREEDAANKEQKLVNGEIKWPIGHVFRHRLFRYVAVIRGWDYKCEASEQWIRQMRVDTLPHGRNQPFYHVVVDDGSARYVAQENVTNTPIDDDEVDRFLANEGFGRYFRKRERREDGRWTFVASAEVEAEYPDS